MRGQFLGVVALTTPQLNVAFICKLRVSLMCFAYYFDMLSMGVCTTSHWQTSGRLVQELNVCTVLAGNFGEIFQASGKSMIGKMIDKDISVNLSAISTLFQRHIK